MPALVPVLMLFCVSLIAAIGWLLSKVIIDAMEPATFLAIRFFIAAIVLMTLFHRRIWRASRREIVISCAMGLLMGISMLFWLAGVVNSSHLGEGAFLVSLNIILIPVISRVLFGTRVPFALLLSLVPAIAGLAVLSLSSDFQFDNGQLYYFACAIGLAFVMALTPGISQQIETTVLTSFQLLMISVVAFIAALTTESMTLPGTMNIWLLILVCALLTTCLRFILQIKAMAHVSALHAAMILLLEPVWTALFSWLFLDQALTLQQMAGCSLIFMAVVFYQLMSAREQKKQAAIETPEPAKPPVHVESRS